MKNKNPRIDRRVLKRLRVDRGWTLERAAVEAGISRQGLQYIEAGLVQPRLTTLVKFARTYGVSLDVFFPELHDVPYSEHESAL